MTGEDDVEGQEAGRGKGIMHYVHLAPLPDDEPMDWWEWRAWRLKIAVAGLIDGVVGTLTLGFVHTDFQYAAALLRITRSAEKRGTSDDSETP